ncbi:hypothetical protein DENSPDRAFT_885791 [Dentipellis sp. KUC8613]|nr:hypothetical protein DENSPDRAFT_885791 [Dentipellis sp. KUC8613]
MVRDFFPTFLSRAAERRKLRDNLNARHSASTCSTANDASSTRPKVADQEAGYPESASTLSEDVSLNYDADLTTTASATDSDLHSLLRTPSPILTVTDTGSQTQPFIFRPDQEVANPSHAFREDLSPINPRSQPWNGSKAVCIVESSAMPALEAHDLRKEVPVQTALEWGDEAYDAQRPTLGWGTLDIRSLWNEPPNPPSTCMASLMEDDLIVYLQDR